jgi:hypothetical protein
MHYSNLEIEIIKNNFGKIHISKLLELLPKRTCRQIRDKAKSMGLGTNPKEFSLQNKYSNYEIMNWIKSNIDNILPHYSKSKVNKERPSAKFYRYGISAANSYILCKMMLSLNLPLMERKWNRIKEFINIIEKGNPISRIYIFIKYALNPTVISFLKGTSQEFSPELLSKIGYIPKNLPISQNISPSSAILV